MKTGIKIISILAVLAVISSMSINGCSGNQDVLNDLQNKHLYLNQRIDTIQVKLNQIEWLVNQVDVKTDTIGNRQIRMFSDIKDINRDIDTLKVGQIIIYDEVTSFATNKETIINWANTLINW